MPHHNRAILSEIAELDLDPTETYVVGKDGALVQSKKNKPFYPEENTQKEEKVVKPEQKGFKKPAVLEEKQEVVSTEVHVEKNETHIVSEELPAVENVAAEPVVEETMVEDAQALKKKKKIAKVQS